MKTRKRSQLVKEEPSSSRRLYSDSSMSSDVDEYDEDDSFIDNDSMTESATSSVLEEELESTLCQFERNLSLKTWMTCCRLFIHDHLCKGTLSKLHKSSPSEFGAKYRSAMGTLSRVLDSSAAFCLSGATKSQLLTALKMHPNMRVEKSKDCATCDVCGRKRKIQEQIVLSGQYDEVTYKTIKNKSVVKAAVGKFCMRVSFIK